MRMELSLHGPWRAETFDTDVLLPGTTDEMGLGGQDIPRPWHPDAAAQTTDGPIYHRLTRRHAFEGACAFSRVVEFRGGPRVFLDCERSRMLELQVNGRSVPAFHPQTLATPHVFELTGMLTGKDTLRLVCDNTYTGLPREDILTSSMATDETQTNWNGILGYIRLRTENRVFPDQIRVLPMADGLHVRFFLDAAEPYRGTLSFTVGGCCTRLDVDVPKGRHPLEAVLPCPENGRWSPEEPRKQVLTLSGPGLEDHRVSFGIRTFTAGDGRFLLNAHPVFLRGEANCAVFPETGYPPMDLPSWLRVMETYRSFGVNLVRFHSHIPPEAALEAADQLGILVQVELDCWNPRNAFESDDPYYPRELEQVLLDYGSHPSLVMLTLGNELHASPEGHMHMQALLRHARVLDPTRLYACASNCHYGQLGPDPGDDFYTSQNCGKHQMRLVSAGMEGPLNHERPGTMICYDPAMEGIRASFQGPVLSFEIGQYEVLPDFRQIGDFRGVTDPENFRNMERKVRALGLADWDDRVRASLELSLMGYRREMEAALRTRDLSGLCLLGIQDFPGQGTALVGMLDSHLKEKAPGLAARFRQFYRDVLPLALMDRMTYANGETLSFTCLLVNYSPLELRDSLRWTLTLGDTKLKGEVPDLRVLSGSRLACPGAEIPLTISGAAEAGTLSLSFGGSSLSYDIWVYGTCPPPDPTPVHNCTALDEAALWVLADGGRVFLAPPSTEEALPGSVRGHFSTNFWSVGTFPHQEGCMGLYLNPDHPLFRYFPTRPWTTDAWFPMTGQRFMPLPENAEPIVEMMTSPLRLRRLCGIFECRCLRGSLLVSSLDLDHLSGGPEVTALRAALAYYVHSPDFHPEQEVELESIRAIVH